MFWGTSRQSNTPQCPHHPAHPQLCAHRQCQGAGEGSALGITKPGQHCPWGHCHGGDGATLPRCTSTHRPPCWSHLGRGGGGAAGVPGQWQPQRRSQPGGVQGATASGLSHGAGRAAVTPAVGSPWVEAGGRGQDGPSIPCPLTPDPPDSLGPKGWERLPAPRATPCPAQAAERAFVEPPPAPPPWGMGGLWPWSCQGRGAPAHSLSPGSRPLCSRGAASDNPIPVPLGQAAAGMK